MPLPSSSPSSSLRSFSPQVFTEVEDRFVEPTETDIEEFARRIGINLESERHLVYLAHEGLMHKLPPNWKPCFEPHRKEWYYFDTDTLRSSWEHPMNSVYMLKVIQARESSINQSQEHKDIKSQEYFEKQNQSQAMDRMPAPRLLKNLPPLKMVGVGGLKPLMPLTPLSTPGNLSKESNSLFSEPLGALKNKLSPLSIPIQLKKSSGLIVTGGGASFLKSSTQKSETTDSNLQPTSDDSLDSLKGGFRSRMNLPTSVPLGQSQGQGQGSLKGILANSMSRSLLEERNNSSLTNWDPNPSFMSGEEKKLWKSLEDSDSFGKRSKGNVKFNLDEDPELHFEMLSQSEKIEKADDTETERTGSTSNSNTEEEEYDEEKSLSLRQEKVEREYKPIVPKNSATSISGISVSSDNENEKTADPISFSRPKPVLSGKLLANQIGAGEVSSERDVSVLNMQTRENMRSQMESELKIYHEELEVEKREREDQMKKHLEQVLEGTKVQNEETIKRFKADIEKQGQLELEKVKRNMDAILDQEISQIRDEHKEIIRKEKEKLMEEHEKQMQDLYVEISQLDRQEVIHEKRKEAMTIIEEELQAELKSMKETLREDQKRQTQQMKDYHASFLYKLKGEFKVEEDNLRRQQSLLMADIIDSQKKENEQMIQSLKINHEIEMNELKAEYELKNQAMHIRLSDSLISINGVGSESKIGSQSEIRSNRTKRRPSASRILEKTPELQLKEKELFHVKAEYEELKEKYKILKQSLQSVVGAERNRMKQNQATDNDLMITTSFVELNTGNGDDLNSTTHSEEEAATSLDITASELKKVNQSKDNLKSSRIDQLRTDSEDRVNKALSALETLREQILEIKAEQDIPIPLMRESDDAEKYTEIEIKKLGGRKDGNVYPTIRRSSDSIGIGKKLSTGNVRMQTSRSATDIKTLQKNSKEIDQCNEISEEESRHLVVEEAKDFIKSQKRRLSRNIPGFGLRHPMMSTTMMTGATPELKQKRSKESFANLRHKDYLYSETESSGLGSLKSFPPTKDKAQVTKDIDCILHSLKKLDKQMKYLWSVVGSQSQSQRPNMNTTKTTTTFDNRFSKLNPPPALLTPLVHPVSPPALAQLGQLVESNKIDYPTSIRSNNSMSTTNQLTSRYHLGPNFFTGADSNLISSLGKMSHTNFNLDEHVNNLRNAQARITNKFPDDDMSISLREKTKDLREWLEKF